LLFISGEIGINFIDPARVGLALKRSNPSGVFYFSHRYENKFSSLVKNKKPRLRGVASALVRRNRDCSRDPSNSLSQNAKVILLRRMFFISSFVYKSKAFDT
jgi:hypothetical protein